MCPFKVRPLFSEVDVRPIWKSMPVKGRIAKELRTHGGTMVFRLATKRRLPTLLLAPFRRPIVSTSRHRGLFIECHAGSKWIFLCMRVCVFAQLYVVNSLNPVAPHAGSLYALQRVCYSVITRTRGETHLVPVIIAQTRKNCLHLMSTC